MDDLNAEIRYHALKNAIEHGGKTREKIILGKILGVKPEFRHQIKEIIAKISVIVADINSIPLEKQRQEIKENFPEVQTDKKTERVGLPELQNVKQVVTRFPPEPNGYPHIGHAKAAIINSEYAEMYEGSCILRLDDTNPEAERMEYHAAIKVGLEWLGIKFDIIKNTSDDMELFYEKGLKLIQIDKAYICTCKRENISKNRREQKACKCSLEKSDKNLKKWEKMFQKFKPGEAIVRFRGDMKSNNSVMRDPTLFRIIDEKHYTLGTKYRVWPSYDFAVAIEDSSDGITHAFRSKEFELRQELTRAILSALNMRIPEQGFFSRLEFQGMPVSKRILRPLIDEGKVSWYDDPRLPTLEALRRRGIKPQAIKKFILSLGMTKSDTLAPFDALEAFNRRIIDPTSVRLFMVSNPKKIIIQKLPTDIEIANHPSEDLGTRDVKIDESLLVDGQDAENLQVNSHVRLLGLGDILITKTGDTFEGELVEGVKDIQKIQWVSEKHAHKVKILIPKPLFIKDEFNKSSLEELEAFVEPHYTQLKEGDEMQFVRFGYCRKDSQSQAIFTHK